MHIVINGMFWREPNTGSGQYLHGLLGALPRVAPEHRYTLLLPGGDSESLTIDDGLAHGLPPTVHRLTIPTPFDGRSRGLAKLWFEQVGVPRAAGRLGADVIHVPYAAAPLVAPAPVVTTVHDIIWHLLPEYRGKPSFRAYARVVTAATRRAAQIIADSEHSRRDIITHLGISPEKVSTVLLGAGSQYRPLDQHAARADIANRYGLSGPFIYYVGGLDARKNVATLLRAWALLRHAGGPEATLVIAGKARSDDTLLFPPIDDLIVELGIAGSVRRVDVPREDNPLLYNAAAAFVFPSRYEGFGLGPLEAMTCGTPVISSNASSLPEVTGEAALLIAPDDVPGWATAMWRVLDDERLRSDLRERGLKRAAQFSYERVAIETLPLFGKILDQPRSSRRKRTKSTKK